MKRKAESVEEGSRKALKNDNGSDTNEACFRDGLFATESIETQREAYALSEPYRHGVIGNLIEPTLLRKVRTEIKDNLSFTPKETDIYKIHQSGDLANLDGLDNAALKALPSLRKLRDALYSQNFRDYLCEVTGCGSLSGSKTDMAINVYTPGCHLLCHDDVIGSRRVSYILYLTDPDVPWREEWGGALRLYPTTELEDEKEGKFLIPETDHIKSIPPAFNQLSFFAVQPGQSFHDVEEVYAAENAEESDARVRMAISGWYHIPQENEEGFIAGEQDRFGASSSLAQLQGRGDHHDRPPHDIESLEAPSSFHELSEEDFDFLLKYITPQYLTPDTLDSVSEIFNEECSILLDGFLNERCAERLRKEISDAESSATDEFTTGWEVARPPHKHRYQYQKAASDSSLALNSILKDLFQSTAFRKWLGIATGQSINSQEVLARRFRRGKDYTLAQNYDKDQPRLEVCLGMTPSPGWEPEDDEAGDEEPEKQENLQSSGATTVRSTSGTEKKASSKADTGEISPENKIEVQPGVEAKMDQPDLGGYLAYMAGDDDDDGEDNVGSDHGLEVPKDMSTGGRATTIRRNKADPAVYQAASEDDDGVLFSMPASWNKLGIILRDKNTMRFVKYVSRQAKGDRWDVFAEYGLVEADDDDDDDKASKDDDEATTVHDEDATHVAVGHEQDTDEDDIGDIESTDESEDD